MGKPEKPDELLSEIAGQAEAIEGHLTTLQEAAADARPAGRHRWEAGRIAARYRAGERVGHLAGEYGVCEMTLYRTLDAAGEPRRSGRPYHPG